MRYLYLFSAAIISGCVTIPEFTEADYLTVEDVLAKTECELQKAVNAIKDEYPGALKTVITANHQLKVTETGKGSGNLSVVIPISSGTFTFGFSGGRTTKAMRDANVKVSYVANDLHCRVITDTNGQERVFEGDLGLVEWFGRSVQILERNREYPATLSYQVGFDITMTGSVDPKFGIKAGSRHEYGGGISLSGERNTVHSVLISATEVARGETPRRAQRRLDQANQQFLLQNLQAF